MNKNLKIFGTQNDKYWILVICGTFFLLVGIIFFELGEHFGRVLANI